MDSPKGRPAFNVYCDESCHLENDGQPVMVLGAVWCPAERTREIAERLRETKVRHGLSRDFEAKWSKVSPAKVELYRDLIDYFLDDDHLHFRGLIATGKSELQHDRFQQDHDSWYYKMYFEMLKWIFQPKSEYRIFLDIKDTRSASKLKTLHDVLCSNIRDFSHQVVTHAQNVRSHEVEQVQLADLLVGAVSYRNRNLQTNAGKVALVKRLVQRTGYSLMSSTLLREEKFNLFRWHPRNPDPE